MWLLLHYITSHVCACAAGHTNQSTRITMYWCWQRNHPHWPNVWTRPVCWSNIAAPCMWKFGAWYYRKYTGMKWIVGWSHKWHHLAINAAVERILCGWAATACISVTRPRLQAVRGVVHGLSKMFGDKNIHTRTNSVRFGLERPCLPPPALHQILIHTHTHTHTYIYIYEGYGPYDPFDCIFMDLAKFLIPILTNPVFVRLIWRNS